MQTARGRCGQQREDAVSEGKMQSAEGRCSQQREDADSEGKMQTAMGGCGQRRGRLHFFLASLSLGEESSEEDNEENAATQTLEREDEAHKDRDQIDKTDQ